MSENAAKFGTVVSAVFLFVAGFATIAWVEVQHTRCVETAIEAGSPEMAELCR